MKRPRVLSTVSVVLVLVLATPCHAHSLETVFWGLGPFAVAITVISGVGCVPLIALITGQALLLHHFIPDKSLILSLLRAVLMFPASRIVGSLPALLNPDVFMGAAPTPVVYIIAVLMFISAVAANSILIAAHYRRMRPSAKRVIWLSIAFEVMLCGGLYLTNISLYQLGLVI